LPTVAPWDIAEVEKVSFFTNLSVQCNKKVDSDENRKKATEATLRDRGPHTYELWTDASVVDEIGAGAAILFEREYALGHARAPSGFLITSFRSEKVAMDAGLLLTRSLWLTALFLYARTVSRWFLLCLKVDNWLSSMIWRKFLKLVQERGVQKIDVQFLVCGLALWCSTE
jgi:hypothetical protein